MPKVLSGNALKIIAVISMTVDHMGAVLFPQALWMRCVGRLAFVLYAFLIGEGYVHTHSISRYLFRLGILAVISEIPFDLLFYRRLFYWHAQNVFFTLFLGLLCIYCMDLLCCRLEDRWKGLMFIPVAAACLAAAGLQCDYKYYGILMMVIFYVWRVHKTEMFLGIALIQGAMNQIQLFGIAALIPISLYNGKRGMGKRCFQWLFYFYYPLHMIILYGIYMLCFYAG